MVGLIFEQKAEIACEYGRFQPFDFFGSRADSFELPPWRRAVRRVFS